MTTNNRFQCPELLTQESLDELSFIIETVCEKGEFFWKGEEPRISNCHLKVRKLNDGALIISTTEPDELRTWFRDLWYPLHRAAIENDVERYRNAEIVLLQNDLQDLIDLLAREKEGKVRGTGFGHLSVGRNYWISFISIIYGKKDDKFLREPFRIAGHLRQHFSSALVLHRFGKEAVFNDAYQSKQLTSLNQFQHPLLLLQWIYSDDEAALDQWVELMLSEVQPSVFSADVLRYIASLFSHVLKSASSEYGWPLAMTSIQWEPVVLSLPERQYASTPDMDHIQDEMASPQNSHAVLPNSGRNEPEKSSGLDVLDPQCPVQSTHPDAEEETDDPIQ
ncbi:hypothetical protein OI450_06115 [Pectobacterium cacticida]|uniref:Uncharacterized protein n=1 Tax=Pectobacterium cacticida TaxID=69221 RepID=A0ABZ2G7E2_9GAMM|nr:hypothetical protein [Pectobacterium cacticida]UYX07945.1 hypothetical protein OI450_06115 [Pectobacterium cacticida]